METNSRSNQEFDTLSSTTTMTAASKKARQKTKPVSSRYLTSPSVAPSPTPLPSPSFADENAVAIDNLDTPPVIGVHSKAIESQRRKQTRLFAEGAIGEDAHQSRKTTDLSRNSLTLMNLDVDRGIALGNFANCSMDWGPKRKEADVSLCRAPPKFCWSSLRLASSEQRPALEHDGSLTLSKPPQHPNTKSEKKLIKESKVWMRQEDAHLLRLLENRYLQWRFVNARAQVADRARIIAAEKSLHNVSCEMSGLRNSVTTKRIEFEQLRRTKELATILDSQMPHLDEWRSVEGDYASSLSGTAKALHNASSRLPIAENVRADTNELKEVLDSAVIFLDGSACVEKFFTKAQETDDIFLELMKIVNREKTLIEQCGDFLSAVHALQVKECSLRSQLVQVKQKITKRSKIED